MEICTMKYILCIFVVALLHFVAAKTDGIFQIHGCYNKSKDNMVDCVETCQTQCEDEDEACRRSCQNTGDIIKQCENGTLIDDCCNITPPKIVTGKKEIRTQLVDCFVLKGVLHFVPPLEATIAGVNQRRRRQVDPITLKPGDAFFVKFNPLFAPRPDLPTKLLKSKKRKCCATASQVIPFVKKIAKNVYPVYCPMSGGYQFIDKVNCHVETIANMTAYGMEGPSLPKMCKVKKCQRICTMRTYLVTNLKPNIIWGHCFYPFLPVWFRNVNVPTHCICPRSKLVKDEC